MPVLNSTDRPLPSNGFFNEDGNELRVAPPGLVIPNARPPLELRRLSGLETAIAKIDQCRVDLTAMIEAHIRDSETKMSAVERWDYLHPWFLNDVINFKACPEARQAHQWHFPPGCRAGQAASGGHGRGSQQSHGLDSPAGPGQLLRP